MLGGLKVSHRKDSTGTGTEIVIVPQNFKQRCLLPREMQFVIFQPDNKCLLSSKFINEAKVNQAWKCVMGQAVTVLGKPSACTIILKHV